MDQQTSIQDAQAVGHPISTSRLPPEERFWKRYSPHHEFSLSGTVSVVLHVLAVAMLLAGGVLLSQVGFGKDDRGPAVGMVAVDLGGEDGPDTRGQSAGQEPRQEAANQVEPQPGEASHVDRPQHLPPLPQPRPNELTPLEKETADRSVEQEKPALHILQKLGKDSHATGSTGTPPPRDPDSGPPTDRGPRRTGPPSGTLLPREIQRQRELRWTLQFNTLNGQDYLRQLRGLDVILAIPQPDGQYLAFRNLQEYPARGRIEDLSNIGRIRWHDERPGSVRSLATALGISPAPASFVAYFPEKFEQELLRKELTFAGRRENTILATQFQVISTAGGIDVRVVSQTPAR